MSNFSWWKRHFQRCHGSKRHPQVRHPHETLPVMAQTWNSENDDMDRKGRNSNAHAKYFQQRVTPSISASRHTTSSVLRDFYSVLRQLAGRSRQGQVVEFVDMKVCCGKNVEHRMCCVYWGDGLSDVFILKNMLQHYHCQRPFVHYSSLNHSNSQVDLRHCCLVRWQIRILWR